MTGADLGRLKNLARKPIPVRRTGSGVERLDGVMAVTMLMVLLMVLMGDDQIEESRMGPLVDAGGGAANTEPAQWRCCPPSRWPGGGLNPCQTRPWPAGVPYSWDWGPGARRPGTHPRDPSNGSPRDANAPGANSPASDPTGLRRLMVPAGPARGRLWRLQGFSRDARFHGFQPGSSPVPVDSPQQ